MVIRTHLIKAPCDNLLEPGSGHDGIVGEPFLKCESGIPNSVHSPYRNGGRRADPVIEAGRNPDPAGVGGEVAGPPCGKDTHGPGVLRRDVDGELDFRTGAGLPGPSSMQQADGTRSRICLTRTRHPFEGCGVFER